MRDLDVDAVTALVERVAAEELLPRFRELASVVVHAKPSIEDPHDVVTEADIAVERVLEAELPSRLEGSIVIGEEAVSRDATLRAAIAAAPRAWLVDPLDGTKNFAAGKETWGIMVTLCESGDAVACWIHLPLRGESFVAQRGAGAFRGGKRLVAQPLDEGAPLRGTAYTHFMPPDVRSSVEARVAAHLQRLPGAYSAAHEYTRLATGAQDCAIWWRLLPWDHAPGALLAGEAGGLMQHPDGTPYRAAEAVPFALAVRHASMWESVRERLIA